MSLHRRVSGWIGSDQGGFPFAGRAAPGPHEGRPPARRRLGPIAWIVVVVGFMMWTLLAWTAYALADGVVGWLAANAGVVVESGKNLATAAGAGKEAASMVDRLNPSGWIAQAATLLQVVLKPAIILLWAVGAIALLGAPLILSRISGLLAGRHR